MEYPEHLYNYSDINEALQKRLTLGFIQENFGVLVRRISDKVGTLKRRIKSSMKYVEDDTEVLGRADQYRKCAELLMSCPNLRDKPGKRISLTGFDGAEMLIELNEELNIIDNSKRYYDKARKTRESVPYNRRRAEDYKAKLSNLEIIGGMLESAETIDDLKSAEKKLIELFGRKMSENQEQEDKFRKFELEGGFVLYVGKNAQNNDELTMRFARPNDLWFHARGAAGSHCVLRIEKNQKPGKDIIRKAAEIAAYYSQARNAKYVPVAYTYKKYVRKPKGSNPGSVVIDREEVVMASPKMEFGD
jgi:predicted ribosome quality control (RQC) complex YloA/Tae2 family protein